MSEVTLLLEAIRSGDATAAEKLFPLVYAEVRQLAAAQMARERPGHTLQPTALLHEAWLRLGGELNARWERRAHFFGAAAEAMRQILVDHARRKKAGRRGSGQAHLDLEDFEVAAPETADDQMLAVNDALEKLAVDHPEEAELVKFRYFAGLTLEQIAATKETSLATVKRSWTFARAWLHREIQQ